MEGPIWSFDSKGNLHFDNEWDFHTGYENYESGYNHNLDSRVLYPMRSECREEKYQFKASLPYNKWVPQCYVPWAQIHYWPSGHVGLVHWCRLIFVHVSVWSFTLLGSDMKMLTGRSVAVFKSSQDVHSALLDAAVPIRWRVSLETDCGREKEFWISLPNIQNPLARGWKGKQKTSQNASHQGLMLSQSW